MSMTCSVCRHPERDEIDRAIVEGRLTTRGIADRYGLSKSAVQRHRSKCVRAALVRAEESHGISRGRALSEAIQNVEVRAARLLDGAERSLGVALAEGDPKVVAASVRAASAALKELRETLRFRAQVNGELPASAKNQGPANVSVIVMPAIPPPTDGKAPQGQKVVEGRGWEDAAIRPLQLS